MALTVPKSVQMGCYLAELVLEGIHRVHRDSIPELSCDHASQAHSKANFLAHGLEWVFFWKLDQIVGKYYNYSTYSKL